MSDVDVCPMCEKMVLVQTEGHVLRWHKDRHYVLHSDCKNDVAILTVGFEEVMKAILLTKSTPSEMSE